MISKGRMTGVEPPPGTTLFLAGMRANKPWRLHEWLAVAAAMGRMLWHLSRRPNAGLLWHQLCLGRYPFLISYWESPEALRRFASDPRAPHAPTWRWFSRRLAGSGSVGVWHETYVIGDHENIYSEMPELGLGKAVGTVPVGQGSASFAQRMARGSG